MLLGTHTSKPGLVPSCKTLYVRGYCFKQACQYKRKCIVAAGSSTSNLGQLSRFASQEAAPDWTPSQRVSVDSFANRGLYTDGSTIFASGSLLLLLLGLSVWRIAGWDRILDDMLMSWREKKRDEVNTVRQDLDKTWREGEDKEQ